MIIDLCSGFGRWDSAKQDVISIDFDKKTKPTIVADIRYLPLKKGLKPDLIHASPPCKYISKARRWGSGWNPKGIAESFKLMAACFDAFVYLEGKNCTFENPQGIEDFMGHKVKFVYDKEDHKNCTTNFYSNNKSLKRANIPQDVRNEILSKLI